MTSYQKRRPATFDKIQEDILSTWKIVGGREVCRGA